MASAVPKPFIGSAAAARLRQARVRKRPNTGWIEPQQLKTRLACARSIPEILETRRRFKDEIELSHLPVAWARLSRLGRARTEREWLSDNYELLAPLVEHTRSLLENEMPTPWAHAMIAKAIAGTGLVLHVDTTEWRQLWDIIEYRAVEILDVSQPSEYALLAWAMVEANHPASEYLRLAALHLCRALKPEANTRPWRAALPGRRSGLPSVVPIRDLALFADAFTRGGSPSKDNDGVLVSIANAATRRVAETKPPHLVRLLRCYSPIEAGCHVCPGERTLARAARELRLARDALLLSVAHDLGQRPHTLKPQELAETIFLYAEATAKVSETCQMTTGDDKKCNRGTFSGTGPVGGETSASSSRDAPTSCKGQRCATSFVHGAGPSISALAYHAIPQLGRYKAYNLSRLANAASRYPSGGWRSPLLQAVEREFRDREGEFSVESREAVLRALALGAADCGNGRLFLHETQS